MNNQIEQHPAPNGAPSYVPPGWYPDPVTGQGERYWDGIDWSRDFTRPAPQQVAPPAMPGVPASPVQQIADIRVSRAESSGYAGSLAIGFAVAVAVAIFLIAG